MMMYDVASAGFAKLVTIVVFVGIPLMIGATVTAILFGLSSLKKEKRLLEKKQNEQEQPVSPEPEQHDE